MFCIRLSIGRSLKIHKRMLFFYEKRECNAQKNIRQFHRDRLCFMGIFGRRNHSVGCPVRQQRRAHACCKLFGVTSLIFYAKGNLVGPVLMFVFCVIYGIISYSYAYYGELITYVFMSLPMAVFTIVSWLKHPSKEDKSQVEINAVSLKETVLSFVAALVVTAVFYFILSALHTTNIVFSTISVATSFIAVYFSFRRSPYYALGYAANDIVLIILWALASRDDKKYISVVVCFVVFLINDLYGFFSWQRRKKHSK